jgi:malate dehydrogenase (oxaloacetate-decarboxylating)(NADP+)
MVQEGLSLQEAQSRISLFDINGLIESKRTDLFDFQKPYAHSYPSTKDFVKAIQLVKPTILIGVSTIGGAFTKEVIQTMASLDKKPIIFALSNPTEHAECTPRQAYEWSNGEAIYAAGVQFPLVEYKGKIFHPGQANNFYIFPAIGMGIFVTQAKRVNDAMFIEAAQALADQISDEQLSRGLLYPLQANILESEVKVSTRVAKNIFDQNLARVPRPDNIEDLVRKNIYEPKYGAIGAFSL